MGFYRRLLGREHRRSLLVGLLILFLALVFQYYAGLYSIRVAGNFSGDIFLDNLPTVNLNPIIVEGALFMIATSIVLIFSKPRYLLFTIKAAAVFIATRAFFVAVTHLGIYPGQINPSPTGFFDQLYSALNLQAGFFFSAHTGLPFMIALIFWRERFWRICYLIASAIFGISVLFAHIHYSIDVFAAPFMAYSIFKLSEYLFAEDFKLITD